MALAGDILKEFLVGIAIAVDEAGLHKINKATTDAEKAVNRLDAQGKRLEKEEQDRLKRRAEQHERFGRSIIAQGVLIADALEAAAKAVAKATAGVAAGFEQAYYASQRTASSVQNLRGLSYAVSQLGGSYEGALGSIEQFARQMRDNPGYGSLVRSLGVATEINGKVRDSTDILADLGKVFASQPYSIARRYAEVLGIDEGTFRVLRDQPDALKRYREEYERTTKTVGLNSEEAAKNSKEFMQSLRSLGDFITAAAQKLISDLTPALKGVIDEFLHWVEAHPEQVQRVLKDIGDVVREAGDALRRLATEGIPALTGVSQAVEDWGKEGGFVSVIKDVVWAFEAFFKIAKQVDEVLDEIDRVTDSVLGKILQFLGLGGGTLQNGSSGALGLGAIGGGGGLGAGALESAPPAGGAKSPQGAPPAKKGYFGQLFSPEAGDNRSFGERLLPKSWGGKDAPDAPKSAAPDGGRMNPREPEQAGTYRPAYTLSDADLDQRVINTIAGEVSTKNPEGVDAVINNMLNRVGTKGWGPSGNLLEVARARGQYAGYRRASEKETEFIRARIRAIASGGVPDNTQGSNSYRAEGYYQGTKNRGRGYWAGRAEIGPNVGGNRYAFERGFPNGPYAPYDPSAVAKAPMSERASPQAAGDGRQTPIDWNKVRDNMDRIDLSKAGPPMTPRPLGSTPSENAATNSSTNTITQTVSPTIRVEGAGDPTAVAAAVAARQDGVNRMSLRNAQSAMR